jgi:hypothetical protein
MTHKQAKQLRDHPVFNALADGKTIQILDSGDWLDIVDIGPSSLLEGDVRIKPTLKLRPWNPEEVPVGAIIRGINSGSVRWIITCITTQFPPENSIVHFGQPCKDSFQTKALIGRFEHSTDGGKTWLPCGVEETT